MAPLTFEVFNGSWTADGQVFEAGVHEIEDADAALVRLASHAHAAGAVNVTAGLDEAAVQSQADGEEEYAKAVAEGRWREGQELQAELERQARDEGRYGISGEAEASAEEPA